LQHTPSAQCMDWQSSAIRQSSPFALGPLLIAEAPAEPPGYDPPVAEAPVLLPAVTSLEPPLAATPPPMGASPPVDTIPPVGEGTPPVDTTPPVGATPPLAATPPPMGASPPVDTIPPVGEGTPPVDTTPPVGATPPLAATPPPMGAPPPLGAIPPVGDVSALLGDTPPVAPPMPKGFPPSVTEALAELPPLAGVVALWSAEAEAAVPECNSHTPFWQTSGERQGHGVPAPYMGSSWQAVTPDTTPSNKTEPKRRITSDAWMWESSRPSRMFDT